MFYPLVAAAVLTAAGVSEPPPRPAADRLAAIRKRVDDAEAGFRAAVKSLPDTPEAQKDYNTLYKSFDKAQTAGFAEAVELAADDPESAAGYAALEWVLSIPRSYYVPPGLPALRLMAEHHAANPGVGRVVALVGRLTPDEESHPKEHAAAVGLIRAVAARGPDREARGQAAAALARQAMKVFWLAEARHRPDVEDAAAEAERRFLAVEREYGDCRLLTGPGDGRTLGDVARANLRDLRSLRVGRPAPEIDAADLEGARLRLSDHRGKVVLLVFWAGWCGPCMAEVPHERALAERFKGRPFVVLGVNGDDTTASAKAAGGKAKVTWRSFWNGDQGAGGPIARAWNVQGWPTVYVIDHAGVIRERYLHGERLDDPLEKLVKAAEAAGK